MNPKLSHDRVWITRFISIRDVDKIITIILDCDKICLSWQADYYQTRNPLYLDFAKNARIRYLSGIVALNVVIKRNDVL